MPAQAKIWRRAEMVERPDIDPRAKTGSGLRWSNAASTRHSLVRIYRLSTDCEAKGSLRAKPYGVPELDLYE
jgi:hypothetical protein